MKHPFGSLSALSGNTFRNGPLHQAAVLLETTLFAVLLLFCAGSSTRADSPWQIIDEGLAVANFDAPEKSDAGDSKVTVIRMDPDRYDLKLLCASEHNNERLTPKEWCDTYHLVAAVNAGMYQEDGITSVGYMKNFGHINNSRLGKDNTILAFNPTERELPPIRIIDRECEDFESLRRKYRTLIQSIRMISCDGKNVWGRQPAKWSILAVGTDAEGRVLLMFCRSQYAVHDFIDILLSLPISLKKAMYLEGGRPASLYLAAGDVKLERYGAWEPGFEEMDSLRFGLPIPNVLGIVKRK